MSINIGEILLELWNGSGFNAIIGGFGEGGWQNLVMLIVACVLLYLAIVKKFEPLLLTGIAFGCLLVYLCFLFFFKITSSRFVFKNWKKRNFS